MSFTYSGGNLPHHSTFMVAEMSETECPHCGTIVDLDQIPEDDPEWMSSHFEETIGIVIDWVKCPECTEEIDLTWG